MRFEVAFVVSAPLTVMDWLPPMFSESTAPMVTAWLPLTVSGSLAPMALAMLTVTLWFSSTAMVSVLLLPMVLLRSFCADMPWPWLPPVSLIFISLCPAPPGDDRLLMEPEAFSPGSAQGGVFAALYRRPTARGRSGSPSRKATDSSQPSRGRTIVPPIMAWSVRSQQDACSSSCPTRSQKKWTLIRPYLSQWMDWSESVLGPTTTTVWMPRIRGLWARGGGA